ncbi:hypothetical protein Salat_1137500 [Sesamum alatum]|uniref:Uncharacterized protein n=1 Tax=Sesamum alatum TaxID=300844 RepID=A0AAE1YDR7_9LAMI|nr:hypothetical protein Salat_1137500 [Sesamum alatum]
MCLRIGQYCWAVARADRLFARVVWALCGRTMDCARGQCPHACCYGMLHTQARRLCGSWLDATRRAWQLCARLINVGSYARQLRWAVAELFQANMAELWEAVGIVHSLTIAVHLALTRCLGGLF